jgi:hypothetical protein
LLALIAILIALPRLVGAWTDYRNPLLVRSLASEPDVFSLEAYRASVEQRLSPREFFLWDEEHKDGGRKVFEATQNSHVSTVRAQAHRALLANGSLAALGLILLAFHWRMAVRTNRSIPIRTP